MSPYGLRHSAASALIAAGQDPKTVADLLGHSSTSTTMGIYCHSTPGLKVRAMDAMGEVLAQGRKARSISMP